MAYLKPSDFHTHIYAENLAEIVRDKNDIIISAIDAAISEAKSYMARYDLVKLFGTGNTAPVVTDLNLQSRIKDIALWNLCNLGTPNIKVEMARSRYEDAIGWFKMITRNQVTPQWPLRADDPNTTDNESRTIEWSSESKRNNHY